MTLLVPTHRSDYIGRCLESVRPQLRRGDEVLVIGDTASGSLPGVECIVDSFGPQYRYVAYDAGYHDYGHSQLNYGISLAQGDYIHCNDDDDIWMPDALETFRRAAERTGGEVPVLFRFKSYLGPLIWLKPGLFGRNLIGGHCLLTPNIACKLGRWGSEYSGDYDYVEGTVNHYGGPQHVVWAEDIVVWARPS